MLRWDLPGASTGVVPIAPPKSPAKKLARLRAIPSKLTSIGSSRRMAVGAQRTGCAAGAVPAHMSDGPGHIQPWGGL